MTVIAYKDGVVACDSRVTAGHTIYTDNCVKYKLVGNLLFWFCGDAASEDHLTSWVFNETHAIPKEASTDALCWDGDNLWHVSTGGEGEGPWKFLLDKAVPTAIGSGAAVALGAMYTGASAKDAVKAAIALNVYCGGKIRTKQLW